MKALQRKEFKRKKLVLLFDENLIFLTNGGLQV